MSHRPTIRVMIVDDEQPARDLLREYLSSDPRIEIAAECANGFEAVKSATESRPDLIFLDIQMPKLSGFEVVELLDPGALVIFCTAHDEHALKAFEIHAVDYLLKPFSRERLFEALARATERLRLAGPRAGALPAGLADAARPAGQFAERILVKDGARVEVIPVDRLDYLEAQDDYIAVHAGGKTWLKAGKLGDAALSLDPGRFVRIHRSYVLNIDRIARLELYAKDSRVARLASGKELPVSRAGYARLRELM